MEVRLEVSEVWGRDLRLTLFATCEGDDGVVMRFTLPVTAGRAVHAHPPGSSYHDLEQRAFRRPGHLTPHHRCEAIGWGGDRLDRRFELVRAVR